jgi:hypothetical protein
MTLLVRDEASIVRYHLDYHLSRGVDFVIATDNNSTDGTAAILREYERSGVLRYLFEPGDDYSQDLWVTRMARLAAQEHAAHWVIHADADEFWWPENDADLKTPLHDAPLDVEGLSVSRTDFVPLSMEPRQEPFYLEQQYRRRESKNALGEPLPCKVAHRGNAEVEIEQGCHGFTLGKTAPRMAQSDQITIFHFPMRGLANFRRKVARGGAAYARNTRLASEVGHTWRYLYQAEQAGLLDAFYRSQTADPSLLAQLVENGELIHDDRLSRYFEDVLERPSQRSERRLRRTSEG